MGIMTFKNIFNFVVIFYVIKDISCDSNNNGVSEYWGEHFPTKYLVPDDITPTMSDLNYYLESLRRSMFYVIQKPNETDVNQALGIYYMKAILKRTLQEFGDKCKADAFQTMVTLIKIGDYLTSHYVYKNLEYGWMDMEFRVSRLFMDDSSQVYSIGNIIGNRLKKWIHGGGEIHKFNQDMDKAILPKEKYAELVESRVNYKIRIPDSDKCLSRLINNPVPIDVTKLQPCVPDPYCRNAMHSSPSVAYTLSHRLLNNMMYRQLRRCFIDSKEADDEHMEMLCANMYREAVYLARRGYFARDIFMEHIALCGMLGFEEFFRRSWFRKTASWVDEDGCMQEFRNFEINRTAIRLSKARNDRKLLKRLRSVRASLLANECHHHPMALALIVLAHGVRHAMHYMQDVIAHV